MNRSTLFFPASGVRGVTAVTTLDWCGFSCDDLSAAKVDVTVVNGE
jgi:hypothetical protein